MKMVVFDGKVFAKEKEEKLRKILGKLSKKPKLVAILVGNNPESRLYLKLKEEKARQLGIGLEFKNFSASSPQKIIDFIRKKNNNPRVNGIIVELPLPEEFRIKNLESRIVNTISTKKDVDCLTSENLRLLKEGKPRFIPPTVKAVIDILQKAAGVKELDGLMGKKICVVGDRGMVGDPLVSILRSFGLEVSGVNTSTQNLSLTTRPADILISCAGVGHLIKKEMVKKGAVVIDVGIEKQPDGSLIGDVDFKKVKESASFITPVPGGVGPVTIICLMENLFESVYH